MSSNFKWASHISKISSKANVLFYNIIRSFTSSSPLFYANLFKSHIRPLLEYNSVIWSPHLISDIKRIESVQRRFTRLVCQKTNTKFNCYEDRLEIMKLDSLETRRVRIDLLYMFKFFYNIVDINFSEHFKLHYANQIYNLRGHSVKLQLPQYSGSTIRNRFFCERVVPVWNALPKHIVESQNLDIFKSRLLQFDITKIYANKI